MSKRNWFYFVLPCYTIGFLIQKEVKVKPIVTCSHFPAFRVSYMYLLSVLIGLLDYLCPVVSDYIGSGFMTPIENCSIFHVTFISTLNVMYKILRQMFFSLFELPDISCRYLRSKQLLQRLDDSLSIVSCRMPVKEPSELIL